MRAKISGKTLKSLPVILPKDDNYARVNEAIDRAYSWIDVVESDISRAGYLIGHLNQEILSKSFRGELVPQDSNDEPASILLERIREERLEAQKTRKRTPRGKSRLGKAASATKGGSMTRNRTEVSENHLSETLQALGGTAEARELWQRSAMDIDEFYKLLRDEMKAGRIKEGADKDRLVLADAA